MVGRLGVLILGGFLSGCHYESVFQADPEGSLSFVFAAILAGFFAWAYTKLHEWRNK